MTDSTANGVISKEGDGYQIAFVRRLKKPIEKVWAALTVPERIADWFADMRFVPDVRLGARVELRFAEDPSYAMTKGEVVAFEPPRLFAWTWVEDEPPGSVIRCELAPDGEGCILTFSWSGTKTKYLSSSAAGWQLFLDGLEGAADGVRATHTYEDEKALHPAYEAQLAALEQDQ
jgi:uncharacterized protein YndB with AHSA1/START domain